MNDDTTTTTAPANASMDPAPTSTAAEGRPAAKTTRGFRPVMVMVNMHITLDEAEEFERARWRTQEEPKEAYMARQAKQQAQSETLGRDHFRGQRFDHNGQPIGDSGTPVFGWDKQGRTNVSLIHIFEDLVRGLEFPYTGMRLRHKEGKNVVRLELYFSEGREPRGMTEAIKALVTRHIMKVWAHVHIFRNPDWTVTVNAVTPVSGIGDKKVRMLRISRPCRFGTPLKVRSTTQIVEDTKKGVIDAQLEEALEAIAWAASFPEEKVTITRRHADLFFKAQSRPLPSNVTIIEDAVDAARQAILAGKTAAQTADAPAPADAEAAPAPTEDPAELMTKGILSEGLDDLAARVEKARQELLAGTYHPAELATATEDEGDKK